MFFINPKYFANFLTFLNLVCGLLALILIFKEHYISAIILFLFGQIFDMFDGKAARKFGGTKNGEIYDDIADGVSFGILPGLAIIAIFGFNNLTIFLSIFYISSVFYRLWRFIKKDKFNPNLKSGNFSGLPSPAGAMIVLSFVLTESNFFATSMVIIFTSLLMISRIQFAHFGKKILAKRNKKIVALFSLGITTTIFISLKLQSLDIFLFYIFSLGIFYVFLGRKFR